MKLYKNIVKDSWRLTFKNKYLWFFGLFAMLLGNGGEYELLFRSIDKSGRTESIWSGFIGQAGLGFDTLSNLGKRLWENPSVTLVIIAAYLFILSIFLFVFWMMNVSQIAIVNAAARQARGKDHNVHIGLQKGIRHFWPVFSLNLIIKFLVIASLAFLTMASNSTMYVVWFLITIPLVISISFILKYTIAYVVVRKENLFNALTLGWSLFKNNWIISLELAVLLYALVAVVFVLFVPLAFIVFSLFYVLTIVIMAEGSILAFNLFYIVMPSVIFLLLAFIGSMLAVFQTSTWTKLFLELDNKGAKSKIERVFSRQ